MTDADARGRRWTVLVDGPRAEVDADVSAAFPLAPELLVHVDGEPARVDVRGVPTGDVTLDAPPEVRAVVGSAVRTYLGHEPWPDRRPDWYRAGWREEVHAWLDGVLPALGRRRTGDPRPAKIWCLSAVLEVPTGGGPLFLKAASDHFLAEPRIGVALAEIWPAHVPEVLAAEERRGWQLMAPLDGADEDDVAPGVAVPTATLLAEIQATSVGHRAALEAAGVPDRGVAPTLAAFEEITRSSPELDLLDDAERAALPEVLAHAARRSAEAAAWGLPETLVHGDLHLGNVASGADGLRFYDWTDACHAHPLVDLSTLHRSAPEDECEAVVAAYVGRWRRDLDLPPDDVVLPAALDLGRAFNAVSYERIQASLEEASRWEMAGVVARCLRRLLESARS